MEWEESVGTGTVYSWVEVVHPAHPALREFGPYMVALVELDDMPEIKLMGTVVDAPLGGDNGDRRASPRRLRANRRRSRPAALAHGMTAQAPRSF